MTSHKEATVAPVEPVDIKTEAEDAYLAFSGTANSRAIPNVVDGLKPVHRRIVYSMFKSASSPKSSFVKTMKHIGEVMGSYHPHGDQGITDAFTTITFDTESPSPRFNIPLVEGQGNWGSLEDSPAAPRYTESRLSLAGYRLAGVPGELASECELNEDGVDFVPTYDSTTVEPVVLPALYPGFLVNNIEGIGSPIKCQSPSHNLHEVMTLALKLVDTENPTWATVTKIMPGPDLPADCDIFIDTEDGVPTYYRDGRGSFTMRARYQVETDTKGNTSVIVTGLPYKAKPVDFVSGVEYMKANGLLDPRITVSNQGTSDIRIVLEMNGCDPEETMLRIFAESRTVAQQSYSVIAYAYHDGAYKTFGVLDSLRCWIRHRKVAMKRRSLFRKDKASKRLHIVEGYIALPGVAEQIIAIVRSSDDRAQALERIVDTGLFTDVQADAILSMSVAQMARLSTEKYKEEAKSLQALIDECDKILTDKAYRDSVLKAEIKKVRSELSTPRRCRIRYESARINKPKAPAVAVPETKMTLSVSHGMWVRVGKRAPKNMAVGNDWFAYNVPVKDTETLEIFSAEGVHHRVRIGDFPEGKPLKVESAISEMNGRAVGWHATHPEDGKRQGDVVLITNTGNAKRIPFESLSRKKKTPASVIPLTEGEHVVSVCPVPTEKNAPNKLCVVTRSGMAVFMPIDKLNAKKSLVASALPVVKLAQDDCVVWAGFVADSDELVLVQEAKSGGARSVVRAGTVGEYPVHNRNVKGAKVIKTDPAKFTVAGVYRVDGESTHLVFTNGLNDPVSVDLSQPAATDGVSVLLKRPQVIAHDDLSGVVALWGENHSDPESVADESAEE